jgi:glycosyltransferase involved in cell wall biosynthesis
MNILFFSRLFYPHIGGVEKHVLEVSRLLIKKGHKIIVVTEQDSLKAKQRESFEGIEIFRIPNLRDDKLKKFKIWKWLWSNYEIMKNADIVHCHDVFFWYLPFRFLFPFKKVFTTFHGYEGYPLKKKDILMHKISEKLSNGNICIGDFIKKWYGTNPTYVSYGGVNIPDPKLQKKIKVKKNSAVFIGRLEEQTGILMYAKAAEIIRKKNPDFEFLVIGEGSCRNKLGKGIKILDPLNNASEYFQKYNFAFAPGYLSALEAMSTKRLVFAVYDNSLKYDYFKMAPFSKYIIISNSPSDLFSIVQYYLSNEKDQEKMVKEAYAWVKKHTWVEMVNTYLKLWEIKLFGSKSENYPSERI